LISLGPAALTAACLYSFATRKNRLGLEITPSARRFIGWANRLFLSACLLSFLGAIIQYRPWQRFLLSAGLDFWAEILLLAALFIWITRTPLAEITCLRGPFTDERPGA
jgi:hypothetical protein